MSEAVEVKPRISDRPYPVPIEMRPLWRIALILIAISAVGGSNKYLDLKKVNTLVWMLIRKNRWVEYENFLAGNTNELPLVSVDTATYRAVEFAIAKDFVSLDRGRLHLREQGEELVNILDANDIMDAERDFLQTNGRRLTEKKVKELTGGFL